MVLKRLPAPPNRARPLAGEGLREAGFTLLEVLTAMAVLAVSILAFQALSMAVARSVAEAQWRTHAVFTAVSALEAAELEVRKRLASGLDSLAGGEQCNSAGRGMTLCTTIEPRPYSPRQIVSVRVSVSPGSDEQTPYTIATDVFSPASP